MHIVLNSTIFILFLLFVLDHTDTANIYGAKLPKDAQSNLNKEHLIYVNDKKIKPPETDLHISIYGVVNSSFYLSKNNFWFATGNWFIDLVNDSPVFDLNMTWYNNKEHSHRVYHIYNFKSTDTKDEILQNNTLLAKGMANISINNQIKSQIPITIQVQKNKMMTMYYNDKIINLHFGNQPLHGLVTVTIMRNDSSSNNKLSIDNSIIQKTIANQQQNLSKKSSNILPNNANNNINNGVVNNSETNPAPLVYSKSIIIPENAGLIGNPSYYPSTIQIKEGDTLMVMNKDNSSHTLTSLNKWEGNASQLGIFFDTDILQPQTSKIIDTSKLNPGVYPFECSIHTFMKGSLIVN